jgi:hypothetical protein
MDVGFYEGKERIIDMRRLIGIYRESFQLHNYSDVAIWKRIKKIYNRDWDDLLYKSLEIEKDSKNIREFIMKNIKSNT